MNRTEELKQKLKEYPDHELIFTYPGEGGEYNKTVGYPVSVLVDEYCIDEERLYLRYEDVDELHEEMCERFLHEKYGDREPDVFLDSDQLKELDKVVKERINNLNWKKCISVEIQP